MSDNEGPKKSGYRLEYAASNRSKCTGPKPCKGTPITKGELRFGSLADFQGKTSFQWRHWGCVTTKIFSNMKNSFNDADELDGFDELNDEDQDRIKKAWDDGHVAPEDVPETAKKADGEEEADDEDKPKKRGGKKKADEDDGKGVFKFEYASSGRSKCKACGESVGKDFFRLGHEVDFRGNKTLAWRHWGCADDKLIEKMKSSYDEPSKVDGFLDLQASEKEKVQRAWDEGRIPEDDKGPGEAVDTGKKKAAPRKKKEDDGEKPKRGRAKAKKDDDEMDEDEDEEKPKKRRSAMKKDAPAKQKAASKKAPKKSKDEDESGEDFGDELAAVDDEEIDEEDDEEPSKKRKRAPTSKGAGSSKPPSKRAKPASSARPASKANPSSSRGKKRTEAVIDEEEEDED